MIWSLSAVPVRRFCGPVRFNLKSVLAEFQAIGFECLEQLFKIQTPFGALAQGFAEYLDAEGVVAHGMEESAEQALEGGRVFVVVAAEEFPGFVGRQAAYGVLRLPVGKHPGAAGGEEDMPAQARAVLLKALDVLGFVGIV